MEKIDHKAEAIAAIARTIWRLKGHELLGPLGQREVLAALEYASEQVALIQELKRTRKPVAGAAAT